MQLPFQPNLLVNLTNLLGHDLVSAQGIVNNLIGATKKKNAGEGQTCELKKCFGGDSACMVESEGKRAISTISESNY